MSITIEKVPPSEHETWDSHASQSKQGTLFHQYTALEVQASHSDTIVHPLAGYKGQEPVGIFPVFEMRKGPVPFVFSPPFGLRVQYLGPAVLNMEKLKQRKLEQRHKRFIDGCIDWIDDQIGPRYVSTRSGWRYDDLRPFKWNEFDVRPSYTYVVDLNVSKDDVMERFSRTTRRRIRNNLEEKYTVEDGGKKAIEWIIQRVNERYEEQGETTPITAAFVMDLYDRLQSGQVHPYVLKIDGEIITGTILLEYGETAQRWQGGVKTNGGLPANELLEWHMMCDAMDRGITSYEIVDANFPRLNEWKTKFGPDARAYYSMMRASSGMNAAVRIYEQIRERNLIP